MSEQDILECKDLKKLEIQLRKRWHPDRAIGLGLDEQEISKYTRISQKIPTCIEIFRQFQSKKVIEKDRDEKSKKKPKKQNRNIIIRKQLAQLYRTGKIDEADKFAAVSFVKAALNNDKALVKTLLQIGVDINGGFTSFPALCFVVKENNLEMTQFLLSLGASPNAEMDARRVIVFALENKNLELAEVLLKAGSDPERFNSQSPVKWTLLMDRIAKDELSFIKLLVKYGADINATTYYPGWSPLLEAVKNEKAEIVNYLLESGADPTYTNKEGASAQRLAGKLGNKEILNLIQKVLKNSNTSQSKIVL